MQISNINLVKKEDNLQEINKGLQKGQSLSGKSVGFMQQPSAFFDGTNNDAIGEEPVDIQEKAKSIVSATTSNHAEFIANSMDETQMDLMKEQGVSPKDEDVETMVTVVDKIQLALAKSGEVAPLGANLSKEQIQEVVGNSAIAYDMAEKLTNLTKEEAAYLINNEMDPTIANVYQAKSSAQGEKTALPLNEDVVVQVEQKVSQFMEKVNEKPSDEDFALGKWMVSSGVVFTEESFLYGKDLLGLSLPLADEEIGKAILQAAESGNAPTNAMLLAGYDMASRAEIANDVVVNATDFQVASLLQMDKPVTIEALQTFSKTNEVKITDEGMLIKARRVLEETRLYMSAKANLSLLKKGIQIETKPLEALVEDLKQQEQEYVKAVYGGNEEGEELFEAVKAQVKEFAATPAYMLPRISFMEMTLPEVNRQGNDLAITLNKANESYETMMTKPRGDLGDNIVKAFRNVDDILEDMGLETSAPNQRAVCILGYNGMEITQEAIANMKLKDAQVQQLFSNMTPRVVLSMIREGYNPLNVPLQELNEKAMEMKEEMDPSGREKYSEFLVELEHQKGISKQERDSYIGIYRLLRQVANSDGAVIGAVYMANEELNMKNLLTQVRNKKAFGYERVADDQVGMMDESFEADLSITRQIEAAYQTTCATEALKQISVEKLREASKGNSLEEMTPEQLLESFRQAEGIQPEPEVMEYLSKQEQNMIRQAAATDRQVMQMLQSLDMPKSPENILALQEMLVDRNRMFKILFDESNKKDDLKEAIKEIKAQIWEDFSESLSAPEDMAKAQEKLADTAEHIMDSMMEDEEMTSLDIRDLRRMSTQLDIMRLRSQREEYAVPVLVSDEYGTVSLKIVRGKEKEEGKVAITLETDAYGKVAASFRAMKGSLQGYVASDRDDTMQQLKAADEALRQSIEAFAGVKLEAGSIAYVTGKDLSLTAFERGVGESEATEEREKTQTKTLYGVAKGFLTNLQQIL